MRLKQRIETLEAGCQPDERHYPVHVYTVAWAAGDLSARDGHEEHTRETCPSCAAMSDEEYAAYREWLESHKHDRVVRAIRMRGPL